MAPGSTSDNHLGCLTLSFALLCCLSPCTTAPTQHGNMPLQPTATCGRVAQKIYHCGPQRSTLPGRGSGVLLGGPWLFPGPSLPAQTRTSGEEHRTFPSGCVQLGGAGIKEANSGGGGKASRPQGGPRLSAKKALDQRKGGCRGRRPAGLGGDAANGHSGSLDPSPKKEWLAQAGHA